MKARDLLFFHKPKSFLVSEPQENRLILLDYISNHDLLSLSFKQMAKYIRYKKDLRDLTISFPKKQASELSEMIQKLDHMPRFLKNLESFRLDIRNIRGWDYSLLLTKPRICEAITSLNLQEYVRSNVLNKLRLLPRYCPNLQSLSIKFKRLRNRFSGAMKEKLDKSFAGFLQSLKEFKQLSSLEITWERDLGEFVKNFMPACENLKNVKIIFNKRCWEEIFPSEEDWKKMIKEGQGNPFENNKGCQEFYQRWESLNNLEALELHFMQFNGDVSFIKYFVSPLLKAIPRLVSLKYHYSPLKKSLRQGTPQRANNDAFPTDFEAYSPFLSGLDNVYSTLEKLKIRITLSDQTQVKLSNIEGLQRFLKLKTLSVKGNVVSEVNLKDLVRLVQQSSDMGSLKLERLVVTSCETLQAMLRTLYQFKRANGLKIELKVILKPADKCNALGILEAFCLFMKSVDNISGLRITFLYNDLDDDCVFYEKLVEIIGKYPEVSEFQFYKTSAFGGFDNYILSHGNILFHYRTDLF